MTQPGGGEPLRKIKLTDKDSTSYELILKGGDSAINEAHISPSPIISGGSGKYGDFDPSFSFIEQRDWSRGFGIENLTEDTSRFDSGRNFWSATPGRAMPQPKFYWSTGTKSEETNDVTWLYSNSVTSPGSYEYATPFTASANEDIKYAYLYVERFYGLPTLTFTLNAKIYDDSGGLPNSLLGTSVNITEDDIIEGEAGFKLIKFIFSSAVSLTSGTDYHIVFSSTTSFVRPGRPYPLAIVGSLDSSVSQDGWSSTVSTSQPNLYYRLEVVPKKRKMIPFYYRGGSIIMAYSVYSSGATSELFINGDTGKATSSSSTTLVDTNEGLRGSWTTNQWAGASIWITSGAGRGQVRTISSNNASGSITVSEEWDANPSTGSRYVICDTNDWYELGTTGLSGVISDVTVGNGIIYMAQGNGTAIRRARINYGASPPAMEYADDSTNDADKMFTGFGSIWACLDDDGKVYRADVETWGTDLTFSALTPATGQNYNFTNITSFDGDVWIFKTNAVYKSDPDTTRLSRYDVGIDFLPDDNNGQTVLKKEEYLYFNWAYALERISGDTVDNLDPNSDAGMETIKRGPISAMVPHPAGVFFAVDAGDDGYSTVNIFDGLAFHEAFGIPIEGLRIQSLLWQNIPNRRPILWIGLGDDLVYQKYPLNHTNPLKDDGLFFAPSFHIDTAVIDMGSKGLLKIFRGITMVAKYHSMVVFYQADEDIGSDTWTYVGYHTHNTNISTDVYFSNNTLSTINALGNIREIKLRFEFKTDWTYRNSPASYGYNNQYFMKAYAIKGFGRTPVRKVWSIAVDVSETMEILGSGDPVTMMDWFDDKASNAEVVLVESEHPRLHNATVAIIPRSFRTNWIDSTNASFSGTFYIELRES